MEAKFLSKLEGNYSDIDESIFIVGNSLKYYSKILDCELDIQKGFQTDFASVPRFPLIYSLFGDRAHHESVIHDYLYRVDSNPVVTLEQANNVFLEAMKVRGKSIGISYPMYWGVVIGGWAHFHKLKVDDILEGR